jgi:hypothetical protein
VVVVDVLSSRQAETIDAASIGAAKIILILDGWG